MQQERMIGDAVPLPRKNFQIRMEPVMGHRVIVGVAGIAPGYEAALTGGGEVEQWKIKRRVPALPILAVQMMPSQASSRKM